jgi:hypothetical protein
MKHRINAYFAALVITIAGSIATLIITRVAQDVHTIVIVGDEFYVEYLER